MGRKSRRAGGRAQLGARQSLGRVMRNKQLGAKSRQQRQSTKLLILFNRGRSQFSGRHPPLGPRRRARSATCRKALGPAILQRPAAFRSPLLYRQESVRFSSFLAFENIISPAFATI